MTNPELERLLSIQRIRDYYDDGDIDKEEFESLKSKLEQYLKLLYDINDALGMKEGGDIMQVINGYVEKAEKYDSVKLIFPISGNGESMLDEYIKLEQQNKKLTDELEVKKNTLLTQHLIFEEEARQLKQLQEEIKNKTPEYFSSVCVDNSNLLDTNARLESERDNLKDELLKECESHTTTIIVLNNLKRQLRNECANTEKWRLANKDLKEKIEKIQLKVDEEIGCAELGIDSFDENTEIEQIFRARINILKEIRNNIKEILGVNHG